MGENLDVLMASYSDSHDIDIIIYCDTGHWTNPTPEQSDIQY
jgi:hypothetical protein